MAVPISEIESGDFVLAYHEEIDSYGYYTVTASWNHIDPVIVYITLDGEEIETTPEHPFLVEGKKWVDAEDLWEGAKVQKGDGSYGTVESLKLEKETQRMYNLTVDEAHTYTVGENQWVVHNASCKLPVQGMLKKSNKSLPTLVFDSKKMPNISKGIKEAQANGAPKTLTRTMDRLQKNRNRYNACKNFKGCDSPDEYPFASTMEGGKNAFVKGVPLKEQQIQGGTISQFYQKYKIGHGDKFKVFVK